MARTLEKLSALKVGRLNTPGLYSDGGGLYLRVTPEGTKNWVFRYMLAGRPRWMGLGPLHTIGLSEARIRATEHRRQRLDGVDPIESRKAARQQSRLEAARAITFKDCATKFIEDRKAGWHNAKHGEQWRATLATYAEPDLGSLAVQSIDTALVMRVLRPIWDKKPETATRVRGRIEAVLDWAKVHGYRNGDNPARWRGHLDKLLPARSRIRKVRHHAALPYAEIGAFMKSLALQEGSAARALEFTILTAARTGETLGARWREIDPSSKVWIIPADRMKAGKEHRVPLCRRAIELVEGRRKCAGKDVQSEAFVFPGQRQGKPLSNMAFLMLLRRMKRHDLTAHGFRSTFRDWAAERTSYPNEVCEAALAHRIANKVEAAYRRGDLFELRRRLMEKWDVYCRQVEPASKVFSIRRNT